MPHTSTLPSIVGMAPSSGALLATGNDPGVTPHLDVFHQLLLLTEAMNMLKRCMTLEKQVCWDNPAH